MSMRCLIVQSSVCVNTHKSNVSTNFALMSPAFSKLFMGVMVDLALIVKILAIRIRSVECGVHDTYCI